MGDTDAATLEWENPEATNSRCVRSFFCRIYFHQRFSEIFQRVFKGPLRDPLRGRFPSQRLSALFPLIVLPLDLSPKVAVEVLLTRNAIAIAFYMTIATCWWHLV